MPRLLQHIDQIAREKCRGVLFVTFDNKHERKESDDDDEDFDFSFDYEQCVARDQLINWFEESQTGYMECFGVRNPNSMESYRGQIYIDVPYDIEDPAYIKVSNYLELPDGTPRILGVNFYYLPLEIAMKNKHHDEPGFTEKSMDDFMS